MGHGLLRCIWCVVAAVRSTLSADTIAANALGIFSPAITLIIYAMVTKMRGDHLNMAAASSTTAILSMITHPVNMIMTILPRTIAALAGFDRVQSFLLKPRLYDHRRDLQKDDSSAAVIALQQVDIGRDTVILHDLNFQVAAGQLAVISGPTSSGKTSLLRAILGSEESLSGTISTSTKTMAYCAQQPWLPNGTIRNAIYGCTEVRDSRSEAWYDTVTTACCLEHDFVALPRGDKTSVGSRGLDLSGGQRQRVVGQGGSHHLAEVD